MFSPSSSSFSWTKRNLFIVSILQATNYWTGSMLPILNSLLISFWLFSSTCSLRMILASSLACFVDCYSVISPCVCVFVNFFFFSFLSHRTSFLFYYHSTPAGWTLVFSLFICFHPYFSIAPHSLWISTRICCVEHVNDCTPIRR